MRDLEKTSSKTGAMAMTGVAVVFALIGAPLFSQSAFDVRDLVTLERVSDPQVSPAGDRVAYVLRSTDLDADRGRTDLWLVDVDSPGNEGGRRLTTHEASDSSPRWAADGRSLFFLSSRSGSTQVWRLPVDGGEAQQVTDLPLGVSNLVVGPAGKRVFFTMEVFPDCETLQCTPDRLGERDDVKTSGVVYDQLFIRHWDTWKEGMLSQLFSLALEGDGEPVALSKTVAGDVPSKPFGGPEEIAVSPDGSAVVFASRVEGEKEAWSTNFDLWSVPADGSRPAVRLTADNPAWDTHPTFARDGALLWLAMERAGYESDRFRLRTATLRNDRLEEVETLTESWDRSLGDFVLSGDGRTVYATASNLGEVTLFAVDRTSGEVTELVSDGSVSSPRPVNGGVVFTRSDLGYPARLYFAASDGSALRVLADPNAERMATLEMGEFEPFTFPGWNGETVHGWVVEPADYTPGKKYPVAFLIHGGPQGSFGNNFHYRWNPQTYAGAGYAAVMVDFHGSTGYGQEFTDSIGGDWGGKPLEDLQKGLAAAIERYDFLDGDKVCALGASYGGYMINWIAGAWPERFRCLVNHDGLFDLRSMYYATEELWFPEWDQRGPYHENPEQHERHNPVNLVENWQTPMLVVHGALDFRVPETQGFQTFTALQRRGIPSKLLYYPDENHWVLKPNNSIQWHDEVNAWLDRWLKAD